MEAARGRCRSRGSGTAPPLRAEDHLILPFEAALPLGALALALFDAIEPLHDDELILARSAGRWRAVGGSGLVWQGRRLTLPLPLVPWAILSKTRWRELPAAAPVAVAAPGGLTAIAVLCTAMLAIVIVGLPLAAVLPAYELTALALFAAYYLLVLAALALVYRRRREWGLDARRFAMLAFDVLACAPFAVNLVRKLTLRVEPGGDALSLARGLGGAALEGEVRAAVVLAVERRLRRADPEEAARLESFRASLQER